MSLGLEEAAALVGGHCWVERRLFELLGTWSVDDGPRPAPTLVLDRHSQHAAWRAQQWWDRLPVLAGVDRDTLVRPDGVWSALDRPPVADPGRGAGDGPAPSDATGGCIAPGDGTRDGGAAVARLAVAYRVLLPRLAGRYGRHAELTAPAADGPVRRTLRHVRADLARDWAEGEMVLQDLLVDAAAVTVAAGAVSSAERLWTA